MFTPSASFLTTFPSIPSPTEIAGILRSTSRGSLRYDRDCNDASSPSSPPSQAAAPPSYFQSVVEEVAEEMHLMKTMNLCEVAMTLNRIAQVSDDAQSADDVERDSVVHDPYTSPKEVQAMRSTVKAAAGSRHRRSWTVISTLCSPADEELMGMERRRMMELSAKKRDRVSNVRRSLDAMRAPLMVKLRSRMEELAKEKDVVDREEVGEEDSGLLAVQRNLREEAKLRAQRVAASLRAMEKQQQEQQQSEALEDRKKIMLEQERQRLGTAILRTEQELSALGSSPAGVTAIVKSALEATEGARAVLASLETIEAGDKMEAVVTNIVNLLADSEARLRSEKVDREAAETQRRRQQEQQLLDQQQEVEQQQQLRRAEEAAQERLQQQEQPAHETGSISTPFGTPRNWQRLEELRQLLDGWTQSTVSLDTEENLKAFRSSCLKAINTPVNAISPVSSAHLKDKLKRLQDLLAGLPVEVGGDAGKVVCASSHPLGIAYCKSRMAKKLVSQGAEVVSAKPEYVFCVAAVVANLWSTHADFGQLFLAQLFQACPYLVPVVFPLQPGQSSEDHLKQQGYRFNEGGEVEKQDKFVDRMSGLARLYAAVAVSSLSKDLGECDHPQGLGHIWSWLAATLNMEPVNDVTATILFDVLDVAGHSLMASYGRVFLKMLAAMLQDYLPKIKSITLDGALGPVTRLEAFLDKAVQTLAIKKPSKLLRADFL